MYFVVTFIAAIEGNLLVLIAYNLRFVKLHGNRGSIAQERPATARK